MKPLSHEGKAWLPPLMASWLYGCMACPIPAPGRARRRPAQAVGGPERARRGTVFARSTFACLTCDLHETQIRRLPYLKRRVTGRFRRSPRQPQRWLGVSVPTGPHVRVARTPDIVVSPASARMPLSMPVESEMGYRRRSGNRQTPPQPVLLEPQSGRLLGGELTLLCAQGVGVPRASADCDGRRKILQERIFPGN